MANKSRILFLLKYLQKHSDEQHALTTVELRSTLAENGYNISIPTLRNDMETLIQSGFDISIEEHLGVATAYSYVDRDWTGPELQILIDAVSSSQFLTTGKSREMIRRLVELASPSDSKNLLPGILVSENIKAKNNLILINVQSIRESIEADRKIRFKYFNYNLEKKKQYRHEGEVYVLSPYATIWMNGRYYAVGYSDKHQKTVQFRIDRMDLVMITEEAREPVPDGFDLHDYTEKIFGMYDGEETEVTLRCKNERIDQVIDKFGEEIELTNRTKNTFDITVPVSLSGTFFSWVFQYAGSMTIVRPEKACGLYKSMLQEALDDTLGDQFPET